MPSSMIALIHFSMYILVFVNSAAYPKTQYELIIGKYYKI